MLRKRMLIAAIPIMIALLIAGWYVTRTGALAAPAIVYIPQNHLESEITRALGATVVAKFEVNRELPAGTTITQWLEYYEKGSRVDVLPGAPAERSRKQTVTLSSAQRNLPIMLTGATAGEQENWFLFAGQQTSRFHTPYGLYATFLTKSNTNARLQYGQPIMLVFGIRDYMSIVAPEGVHDFSGEQFSDEFIEHWLEHDVVFVMKVQIDLPQD